MSESQPTASTSPATSDLGVVDPIRLPGVDSSRRLWSGLPPLGQLFVALVVVDVVIRALGLFRTSLFLEVTSPITWLTAFLPHDALILLPAVILYRRPTASTDYPLLARGAVAIALVELLKDPVRGLLAGAGAGGLIPYVPLALIAAIVTAFGFVLMARDLGRFVPETPWDSTALIANVVGGALALTAIIATIVAIFSANADLGDAVTSTIVMGTNAAVALTGLGLAYFARVVVRGMDDPARPATARKLATASMAALAVGSVLTMVAGQGLLWVLVLVASYVGGMTGLVVAFGLGLADPSGTIDRAVPTDNTAEQPEPEQPAPA